MKCIYGKHHDHDEQCKCWIDIEYHKYARDTWWKDTITNRIMNFVMSRRIKKEEPLLGDSVGEDVIKD